MKVTTQQNTYAQKQFILNTKLSQPQRVNCNENTIYTKQALIQIASILDDLQKDGKLQFRHRLIKNEDMSKFKDTVNVRLIRRVVKLRFKCINQRCSQFYHIGATRRWTSYYGLVDFQFFFEKLPNSNYTVLNYSFYIYRQKCLACLQWGKSGLIYSCYVRLLKLYFLLLRLCLTKIKQKKQKQIRWGTDEKHGIIPKMEGISNGHMISLCQACAQRVCLRLNRPNYGHNSAKDLQGRHR